MKTEPPGGCCSRRVKKHPRDVRVRNGVMSYGVAHHQSVWRARLAAAPRRRPTSLPSRGTRVAARPRVCFGPRAPVRTSADFNPNFARMLWDTATRVGDRAALAERGVTTTYAALVARAAAIGRALQDAGVEPGDRAAVFLERRADAAAPLLRAPAAGAVVADINQT